MMGSLIIFAAGVTAGAAGALIVSDWLSRRWARNWSGPRYTTAHWKAALERSRSVEPL